MESAGENFEYTEAAVVDIWTDFLESYRENGKLEFYYMDRLVSLRQDNKKVFRLDYDHLTDYNVSALNNNFVHLRFLTHHDPDVAKRTLKAAVLSKLRGIQPDYADEIERDLKIEFENAHLEKEIPDLSVSDCGKLVKITGLMTTRDEVSRAETIYTVWNCEFGHKNKTAGTDRPRKCKGAAIVTTVDKEDEEGPLEFQGCDSLSFKKDEKSSYSEDYIRFDIQQRSEKTSESRPPVSLPVEVIGTDNVVWARDNLSFNQNISITGIPRTRPGRAFSGQGKVIQDIYLEASTIDILPEHYFEQEPDPALDLIVQDTVRHDIDPQKNAELEKMDLEKLIASICPSLYMSNTLMKELILMWLVGSDPLMLHDKTRIRGEGQFFLLGDPGMGKSQIAGYVRAVWPRVMYNSSASTSVGLVGGLVIGKDGISRITPGVFGLAKNAGVILDEFASRTDKEYMDLLEPLSDQQTVTIAKGGDYKETRVNTAVLCIANPSTKSKYYNPNKSIIENTNLPPTILQRMDIVLIMQDKADPREDAAKARAYLENIKNAVSEEEFYRERPDKFKRRNEKHYGLEYMKRYIAWARENCHPRITDSPEACRVVEDWYAKARGMKISVGEDGPKSSEKDVTEIPAGDMRKLGSCMRLTQMHARASLRNHVLAVDAERACFYMDITMAEAGWWKMGADGSKEYDKDALTEYRKKKQGEWEQYFEAIFAKNIQELSFEKCYQCRGDGERIEIGGAPELCVNCDAVGRIPIKFSQIDMIVNCVGTGQGRMTQKSFNKIWDDWLAKSMLVPTDDDGMFRNLTPYAGSVPNPKNSRSAKDRLKERTMRDHPGVWKRFVKETR